MEEDPEDTEDIKKRTKKKHKRATIKDLKDQLAKHTGQTGAALPAKPVQQPHNGQPPAPGKAGGKGKGPANKQNRIPDDEFTGISKCKDRAASGTKICRWYNCSLGCSNAACTFAHECCECGQQHSWASQHK